VDGPPSPDDREPVEKAGTAATDPPGHGWTRRQALAGLGLAGVAALAACRDGGSTATASTHASSPPVPSSPPAGADATASTPQARSTTSPPAGAPARFVSAGPSTSSAVALTFHASGDVQLATRLLDLLRERAVPVTVFVVGKWLAANPSFAQRIPADGHELGNHTYSHLAMGSLSRATTASEITKAADVLRQLTGSPSRWFRPSGIEVPTATILQEAGRAGYGTSVGYSLDSLDYTDPGSAAVVRNVNTAVTAGSIVSLHFGHAGTIAALPAILDHLSTSQLRPVKVSGLLA
jgi:peptidoglycan/xylan/chitin deacetylase (PgdA/CDA1 family)